MSNDHGRRFAVNSPTGVHIGLWPDGKIAAEVAAETPGNTVEELIRADHVDALIAAAVEASADLILQRAHNYYSKPGDAQSGVRTFASAAHDWLLEDVLNSNARQALDALLKAERDRVLKAVIDALAPLIDYDERYVALKRLNAFILKDATDG